MTVPSRRPAPAPRPGPAAPPAVEPDPGLPLSRVPTGVPSTVLAIDGPERAELEREGLIAGRVVTVRTRTPLGGPIVVELGRARLALSADVAARIRTAPEPSHPDEG